MKDRIHVNAWVSAVMLALLWAAPPPESPIADAAMRDDIESVRSLLEEGAEVNLAQSDGMTALHWAAELGNVELVGLYWHFVDIIWIVIFVLVYLIQ